MLISEKTQTQIFIYKTNIENETQKALVFTFLKSHLELNEFSVDLEDVDKVLRLVSPSATAEQITSLISQQGFICEELV